MDAYFTRRDEHLHMIAVRGDVDLAPPALDPAATH